MFVKLFVNYTVQMLYIFTLFILFIYSFCPSNGVKVFQCKCNLPVFHLSSLNFCIFLGYHA